MSYFLTVEMLFIGIVLLFTCNLSQGFPAPVDTVVLQIQHWGVVGNQQVMYQVLLNGVSLSATSQEADSIIQTISADAHLSTLSSVNQTSALRNHTLLRSQECILEGSQLHWTDRVFLDGKVYLTLDHNDSWKAHNKQAYFLKLLLDQEVQDKRKRRINLQDECNKLIRELKLSEEHLAQGSPLSQFLIPVFALCVFVGLIVISILHSKKGFRAPGGVIGSVIHYTKEISEGFQEVNGSGYRTW